jgi:hypothetical protein
MSNNQLRNCNFGSSLANATGSSGVGYTILDETGAITIARTTTGVYQTAPGIYAAYVSFPDNFRGQILWDTGSAFASTSYATEQYNVEENDPRVASTYSIVAQMSGTLASLYDSQFGKWEIVSNQMIFYKADNVTEIARYDLFDASNVPTMDAVFKRVKV